MSNGLVKGFDSIREWLGIGVPSSVVKYPHDLSASYWNGAEMVTAQVREFETSRALLVTSERWYIGTIFRLTLEYEADKRGTNETHVVTVDCKATRHGPDGMAVEFMTVGPNTRKALREFFEVVRHRETSRPPAG